MLCKFFVVNGKRRQKVKSIRCLLRIHKFLILISDSLLGDKMKGNTFFNPLLVCIKRGLPLKIALCCDVHISVLKTIPLSCHFLHPVGIVISENVKFGENCTIAQNVTIGYKYPIHILTTDKRIYDGVASIGNNVFIGANSILLGKIKIGDNVIIGANSLILRDVPSNKIIKGTWKAHEFIENAIKLAPSSLGLCQVTTG